MTHDNATPSVPDTSILPFNEGKIYENERNRLGRGLKGLFTRNILTNFTWLKIFIFLVSENFSTCSDGCVMNVIAHWKKLLQACDSKGHLDDKAKSVFNIRRKSQAVWPDLAKFRNLGKLLRVYLGFGKILSQLLQKKLWILGKFELLQVA